MEKEKHTKGIILKGFKIMMDLQKVIKYIEQHGYIDDDVKDMVIEAIKKKVLFDQIYWERLVAISQLEEIGISLGQKTDNVKEAVEKQIPKKVLTNNENIPICPSCKAKQSGDTYCGKCGQKLKWW